MSPIVGILSAIVGTAAMTVSSETEMTLSGRDASQTPGKALSRILGLFGVPELEGKSLRVASTWMHWLYGAGWGLLFWLLADDDFAGLPLALAGLLFWIIVWGAAQVVQPALGVAKPILSYGAKATVIEGFHHLVYAAATALAAWLMLREAGGPENPV